MLMKTLAGAAAAAVLMSPGLAAAEVTGHAAFSYNSLDDDTSGTSVKISALAGAVSFVFGSTATITGTAVIDTQTAASGLFGDGISVFGQFVDTTASIESTLIDRSVRAGLASFGAVASVESTTIQCAAFDIDGESYDQRSFAFDDRGGNLCGCPAADATCVAVSSGLLPPVSPE